MKSSLMRLFLAGLVATVLSGFSTETAHAQCSTCPTATVAYQPVVAQTTVAYQPYTGWYPGKMFDSMRLRRYDRRYGVAPVAAQTYTAAYAPYTVGYAPYTAAYRPYVTSYAPLARTTVARPVLQTSYYVPAASSCSSCVQTVARQVVMSPVVSCGCSTCATGCSSCSTCSSCSSGVSQASYTEPACSSCATGSSTLSSGLQDTGSGVNPEQPYLNPDEPVSRETRYGQGKTPDPAPEQEEQEKDPYELDEKESTEEADPNDTNTSFEAPQLLNPRGDRTAQRNSSSRVSVDVRNAVYRQPATRKAVQQTSYKPTQVNLDADGWSSVPRSR